MMDHPVQPERKKFHIDLFYKEPLDLGGIRLIQLGRLYCKPDAVIDRHTHEDFFELTLVTAGKGRIYAGEEYAPVSRGDIFLSFPFESHCIVSDAAEPLEYDFAAFRPDDALLSEPLEKIRSCFLPAQSRTVVDDRINYLIQNGISELKTDDVYCRELLGLILRQVAIYLIRDFDPSSGVDRASHASGADALCFQMMNYVETHLYSMKNLREISDHLKYNYSYLSDLYRRHTGNSLEEFFRERRLEEAKRLLDEETITVTRIAELLNYASIYSFSRAFKSRFGVSPEQYRKG